MYHQEGDMPGPTGLLSKVTDIHQAGTIASGVMPCRRKCLVRYWIWASAWVVLAPSFAAGPVLAQQPPTIERLITEGWELVGYVAAWENRSLILFRHKDHKYLVQCSVLIDVTRAQHIVTACYELK
jgi:hypothetical protein